MMSRPDNKVGHTQEPIIYLSRETANCLGIIYASNIVNINTSNIFKIYIFTIFFLKNGILFSENIIFFYMIQFLYYICEIAQQNHSNLAQNH